MSKTYCIIGTSAAGIAAAQKLRQLDPQASIICISDEKEMPYNKCMLADYVSGEKDINGVHTLSAEQATKKNITLLLGKKVVHIDAHAKIITLNDASTLSCDALLLAVGTSPVIPSIKGIGAQGVFAFHRLSDINSIMHHVKTHGVKTAVVIGSGLSGLECADALMAHGIHVSIVERNNDLLASLVNERGSRYIQHCLKAAGGRVYTERVVQEIVCADDLVHEVLLSDGTRLQADLVIVAVGISPNLVLAKQLQLALHENLGIAVDEYMQTSVSNIFAAGDIVVARDQITGTMVASRTWPDAMLQGITAAHAMAGQPKAYPGLATVISSSFFGIKFARFGIIDPIAENQQVIEHETPAFYHRFIVENSRLKGFLLVGNTAQVGKFRMAVLTQSPIDQGILRGEAVF